RRAEVFGVSGEQLERLRSACVEMQEVYNSTGQCGLTAYMLEHMPQAEGGAFSVQRAVLYGTAGKMDSAFENLDRALASRHPALVHLAVAPQWDGLREDPRFRDRLRQMKLA